MNRSITAFITVCFLSFSTFSSGVLVESNDNDPVEPFALVCAAETPESPTVLQQAANEVGNDEKLPLDVIPRTSNDKIGTATNLQYSVSPTNAGTFEPLVVPDPVIDQYFVPADGYTGSATITVTGLNKKGVQINGSLVVSVLAGPAVRLEVVPLAPVPK